MIAVNRLAMVITLVAIATCACAAQSERVRRVLELELRYDSELVDWNRVETLFSDYDGVTQSALANSTGSSISELDLKLLARSGTIFLQELLQIIPEYSSFTFDLYRCVEVKPGTHVLQWTFTRSDADGTPSLVELVFKEGILVKPKTCVVKETLIAASGFKGDSFCLRIDFDTELLPKESRVGNSQDAKKLAQEAVIRNPVLKNSLSTMTVVRQCSINQSLFWIVWFVSNDEKVKYESGTTCAWLSADTAENCIADDGDSLKIFPILVRESGKVFVGAHEIDFPRFSRQ